MTSQNDPIITSDHLKTIISPYFVNHCDVRHNLVQSLIARFPAISFAQTQKQSIAAKCTWGAYSCPMHTLSPTSPIHVAIIKTSDSETFW
jgi:hypothetical protein